MKFKQSRPTVTVHPIHFEDFDGKEFERLVLAYHLRAGWKSVAWYGQTGSDQGRDIVGAEQLDDGTSRDTVVQCVNRGTLAISKATGDMRNAIKAPRSPRAFRFVCRSTVSARKRDAIMKAGHQLGIDHIEIWADSEFEERLRLIGEDLLQRFCQGVSFPDDVAEARRFVDDFPLLSDDDALILMGAVLDRPAFRVPFQLESSLPNFSLAIEDSIRAFNTGIWRTREGDKIRRIPSIHNISDPQKKAAVARTVQLLDSLRRTFTGGIRDGTIRHCSCGNESCPTFFVSNEVAGQLDRVRSELLTSFRRASPSFNVVIE